MGKRAPKGPPPGPEAVKDPQALATAIRQFNSWRFWECHETLEGLWRAEETPLAHFYHGLIKAAAGLHHLLRGNHRGATILLRGAIDLLSSFPPRYLGLDVEGLVTGLKGCLAALEGATGPPDLRLIPIIRQAEETEASPWRPS